MLIRVIMCVIDFAVMALHDLMCGKDIRHKAWCGNSMCAYMRKKVNLIARLKLLNSICNQTDVKVEVACLKIKVKN